MALSPKAIALLSALAAYYVYRRLYRRANQKESTSTVFVHSRENETAQEVELVRRRLELGLEFFTEKGIVGSVLGRDGVRIHYNRFESPDESAVLLFLTGWSESMIKYGDFFKELCGAGITVVCLDHRSQGFSGRPRRNRSKFEPHDALKSHVEDFHDHVTDALLVLNTVVAPRLGDKKLFLAGFSLGGLVASHVATMMPSAGLILVAPCLLPLTPYPPLIVRVLTTVLRAVGKGEDFVPGHPFGTDHRMLMPPKSRVSSSSARVAFWERLRLERSEVCINGMSVAHLDELMKAEFGPAQARRLLTTHILVVSAELDLFVNNQTIFQLNQAVAGRIPCRHVHIHGAKHELLHEREEIRSRVVEEILVFLDAI